MYIQASAVRAVLSPGDVLYLPAYWHHEVQSIPEEKEKEEKEEEKEGLNIAVNFWFQNVTNPINDLRVLGIM